MICILSFIVHDTVVRWKLYRSPSIWISIGNKWKLFLIKNMKCMLLTSFINKFRINDNFFVQLNFCPHFLNNFIICNWNLTQEIGAEQLLSHTLNNTMLFRPLEADIISNAHSLCYCGSFSCFVCCRGNNWIFSAVLHFLHKKVIPNSLYLLTHHYIVFSSI